MKYPLTTLFLLAFYAFFAQTQTGTYTELWGMTSAGGAKDFGAVFKINNNGNDFELLHSISDGDFPQLLKGLVEVSNGYFYGTTKNGGINDKGVLFKYNMAENDLTVLHDFADSTGAPTNVNRLVEYNGSLYGVTNTGGQHGIGTIYSIDTTTNSFSLHFSFIDSLGSGIVTQLVEHNGLLYGCLRYGGAYGFGTLFEFDPGATPNFSVLKHFNTNSGREPDTRPIIFNDKIYGTTNSGGQSKGTIWEYDIAIDSFMVRADFEPFGVGYHSGELIEHGGFLYGMTSSPTTYPYYGRRYRFNPITFAIEPRSGIDNWHKGNFVKDQDSLFYLVNAYNGFTSTTTTNLVKYKPIQNSAYILQFWYPNPLSFNDVFLSNNELYLINEGSLGKINHRDANPERTIIRRFAADLMGNTPNGDLVLADTIFIGVTSAGGAYGKGLLFSIDSAAPYDVKAIFHFGEMNHFPSAPVHAPIQYNGKFYGLSYGGGSENKGTLYKYDPNHSDSITVLYSFVSGDTSGTLPRGQIAFHNGKIYGFTEYGGLNDDGILFESDTLGNLTILHHFNQATGANPVHLKPLFIGDILYGTTSLGGSSNGGVLFKYDFSNTAYTDLYHFSTAVGKKPLSGVIEVDGNLYGLTREQGASGKGTIFKYNPTSSEFSVLRHFSGVTGQFTLGSLRHSEGKLYGMSQGGSSNKGLVFKTSLDSIGTIEVIHHFFGADGNAPVAGLTLLKKPCVLPLYSYNITGDDCPIGQTNGVIEFNHQGPIAGDFSFSINGGGDYQTDSVFMGLTPGDYSIRIQNSEGCISKPDTVTVPQLPDNTPPTLTCPQNLTLQNNPNDCSTIATFGNPSISDNCQANPTFSYACPTAAILPLSGVYFGLFPVGQNQVTFTGSDVNGNLGTCAFTVEVMDTQVPVLTNCPADLTVNIGNSTQGTAVWTVPTASDNCPAVSLDESHTSGSMFALGNHTISFTATDASGLTASCGFLLTMERDWYEDADGDGFGKAVSTQSAATQPSGFVGNNLDCNDGNANINPNATELCNGADDNCNGMVDEGLTTDFYPDGDNDGFGDATAAAIAACNPPLFYVDNNLDCDDANPAVNPSALEICNGIDDDCNGLIDETACNRPTNVVASSITSTSAVLHWNTSCSDIRYWVRYRPVSPVRHGFVTFKNVLPDSILLENLSYNTEYIAQIRTLCPQGWSTYKTLRFTTDAAPACSQTYFTGVLPTDSSLTFVWQAPYSATHQRLYWNEVGSTLKHWIAVPLGQNSYTISGLNANTNYNYRLRVRCAGGWLPLLPWNRAKTLNVPPLPRDFGSEKLLGNKESELLIYPNPSAGVVTVFCSAEGEKNYALLNLQGQIVRSFQSSEQLIDMELSDLAKGVYLLKFSTEKGKTGTEKLILLGK